MADNNFNENNSLSAFSKRSNPLAYGPNVLKLKVEKPYGEILEIVGQLVIDTAADTATFTAAAPTDAYDVRYFQIVVCDESGNQAAQTATGVLGAPIVVDTSALNEQDNWFVTFYFSTSKEVNTDNGDKTFGTITIKDVSSDPTIDIDTVAANAPQIAVFEADGSTAIANGGAAYALGSFSAGGGSLAQSVVVKNNGEFVLEITSITVAPDVDGGDTTTSIYVYPNQSVSVPFTIDTSGGAGAKTGSLTLNSTATPSAYVVNVSFTLV